MNKERILSRDVTATQIPSGERITLAAGTKVHITQTLGGSYTVIIDFGLARIDGRDADALGERSPGRRAPTATAARRRTRSRGDLGPAQEGLRSRRFQ